VSAKVAVPLKLAVPGPKMFLFNVSDIDTQAELQRLYPAGQLSLYERRVVALARAMLMEPDILIYDFTFAGLERDAAQQLMKLTGEFHGRKAGRVSLYLCPDDAVSARLAADSTITLTQ